MNDQPWLEQALAQAEQALLLSSPNPAVGCVIVREGQCLGQGHTQAVGGAHAEVMALREAAARGHSVRGATAYVTLEPCAHHGRTPPCADALVREGLSRVVVACRDPNPLVAGLGVQRLQGAGIAVEVLPTDHPAARQARELLIGFLSRMVRQRPWVRLKVAASLDGRTALHNGVSQWITDAAAREDGQRWRARASAILTGVGTVLADNPRLDVRALATPRPPLRVVLDSHWRMPTASAMLHTPGGVLVVGLAVGDEATARRQQALQAAGAEVCVAPRAPLAPAQQAYANGPQGVSSATAHVGIDLAWLWPELARRGINELHVEAGARLNGSLLAADAVDELLLYLAPKLLGPGRGLADLPALQALSGAWQGEVHSLAQVGADVRLQLRPPGRAHF